MKRTYKTYKENTADTEGTWSWKTREDREDGRQQGNMAMEDKGRQGRGEKEKTEPGKRV